MVTANDSRETAAAVRAACRSGQVWRQTSGLAPGFAQANLVILPAEFAYDFLRFCQLNPKPCPLLSVTAPGAVSPEELAAEADLRTDLPGYRVWRNGELVEECPDITAVWQPDFVSFLIGCSFTFESALLRAGVPVRHIEQNCNVPMYHTNRSCRPAGPFRGPLVVSMRPLQPPDAIRAIQITSRFPGVHGAPVHLGLPDQIGIRDLSRPDYGDAVAVHPDELPVFWACGVTPQAALMQARLPLAITHQPGGMFVTDRLDEELAVS